MCPKYRGPFPHSHGGGAWQPPHPWLPEEPTSLMIHRGGESTNPNFVPWTLLPGWWHCPKAGLIYCCRQHCQIYRQHYNWHNSLIVACLGIWWGPKDYYQLLSWQHPHVKWVVPTHQSGTIWLNSGVCLNIKYKCNV